MKTFGLRLDALDTLFFRDGRPFNAASRAESTLPSPQSLTGALRTWLMRLMDLDFQRFSAHIRDGASFADALGEQGAAFRAIAELQVKGPWLAQLTETGVETLFLPVPAALKQIKDGNDTNAWVRSAPLQRALPGWNPPLSGMLPIWTTERRPVEAASGFVTLDGMKAFLEGRIPKPDQKRQASELFAFEERTGLQIDARSQAAQEGLIYAIKLLRLAPGIGFYARVNVPDALQSHFQEPATLPWGGEGRRVLCQQTELIKQDTKIQAPVSPLALRVFTTPCLVESPDVLSQWRPLAAALLPWQGISGWDLALGGPKPLRWLLPAGSVLYFKSEQAIPRTFCSPEAEQIGWGHYLEGVSEYV